MRMTKAAESVLDLIGHTPVLKLKRISPEGGGVLYLKLEGFNPGGSIKDRPALMMLEEAEKAGALRPGMTVVEPTSGNTGIGLAMVAAVKGYKAIIVMPENMSKERQRILKAYGAELVLTPAEEGMAGALRKTQEILEENPDYFCPGQFQNPANPLSHELTTARELWEQIGPFSALVAGIGTGGTITGLARFLKKVIPEVQIIGVEPNRSPVLRGGSPGPHEIQGIGPGFVPEVLDLEALDRIMGVEDEDAVQTVRLLARREGILVGISTGAAVYAALQVAKEMKRDEKVVVISPDGADKYLSTRVFDW